MGSKSKTRSFGVLACVISVILFVAGALTDHWVVSDNGHWGLWEYCDVSTNGTSNLTTTPPPTTVAGISYSTTTPHDNDDDDDKKDEDDEKDEDDDCSHFDISSLPAFLHIVRAIIVFVAIVLAWGLLSGRTMNLRTEQGHTFIRMHLAELLGIIACSIGIYGTSLFEDNYKTFRSEIFTNSSLGWSFSFVRMALYLFFLAAFLMMFNSIKKKWKEDCDGTHVCRVLNNFCIRIGLNKREDNPRRGGEDNHIVHYSSSQRRENGHAEIGDINQDLSLQMSETDSDIFTVTVTDGDTVIPTDNTTLPSNNEVPAYDLPQYEDIVDTAPPVPPPPTYDDVMMGQYLAFPLSSDPPTDDRLAPPRYDSVA